MVSPAAFKKVGTIPTQPVGAGPFTLTSYVPDSHADLTRNPGYWDASQIHVANFTVQDITEPEQILAAAPVRAGERRLHRGQPGGGGQGGRVQGRRDPVRGRQRARHPDHDRAVQQPGRGRGDQLRDQPAGDPAGPGVRLRRCRVPAVPRGLRRVQPPARQPLPVQPDAGQAAARQGRLQERAEDHPDRPQHRRLAGRADPGPSSPRSASPPRSATSPPTPRPSTSTWTRPSRSRSTGRPAGCRRWRCSTSSTASRA